MDIQEIESPKLDAELKTDILVTLAQAREAYDAGRLEDHLHKITMDNPLVLLVLLVICKSVMDEAEAGKDFGDSIKITMEKLFSNYENYHHALQKYSNYDYISVPIIHEGQYHRYCVTFSRTLSEKLIESISSDEFPGLQIIELPDHTIAIVTPSRVADIENYISEKLGGTSKIAPIGLDAETIRLIGEGIDRFLV